MVVVTLTWPGAHISDGVVLNDGDGGYIGVARCAQKWLSSIK